MAAESVRVADSYAALTDARPFRPAMTEEDARASIVERAAIEFDPAVGNVLLSLQDLEELRSYAKPVDPPDSNATADDGWNLFSLFMR